MKNEHNKLVGSDIQRSDDRIDLTGEVFTPLELCVKMINDIPLDVRQNRNYTFLAPAEGNGNFSIALSGSKKDFSNCMS